MGHRSFPTARGWTRRGTLAAGTAMGALGAFGPGLLSRGARAQGAAGEVLTGSHWGAFHATVEDGRWTQVRPWEEDPYPTQQLEGILDSVYSPTRIRFPMVRRAYLEGGPGASTETRGNNDFVRVSWDEALDLVAKEVARVQETHGPAATFAGSYGWKSPGKLHNCQTLLRRMLNLQGSFVNSSGDYSTGAAQIVMPHVVGTLEVYEQQTVWPVVVDHTELLVFWGADPYKTNQIGWIIPDHGAYPGMEAFAATGKPVICIDPVYTETARRMNAEWIPIRPHTDTAMMLGVAHSLYTEALHDQGFLDEYTTGFDQFLAYLLGESDGTPKSAEWAAAICDVPAEKIHELARRFADSRTMLASGWAIQRQHHGEQSHWMLVTLASMLGQIGLPGGGFGLSYHYANGGSPGAESPVIPGITDGGRSVEGAAWLTESGAATIPVARIVDMLENPGGTFEFNGTTQTYPDIRMVYWVGGNPFFHHPDRNRMVKAWQKLETVIVHDFQWTATARFADIVLPATTSYERNDIEQIGDYSLKGILAMKKVVEPVFEARSDYDIFADIAERLGKGDAFTEGKSEMEWIREFYEAALPQAAARGIEMPDFEAFWERGALTFEPTEAGKSFVRYAEFREDPLFNPLGTPSGLIEIYSRNIERMNYDDCPPHPTWMEPVERQGRDDSAYPFHVVANHPPLRLHSQLNGTKLREAYAVAGREPCWIHPDDAAARGLADGDIVRVFNDRGQLLAGVVVTDAIRPGAIQIREGGWYSPAEGGEVGSLDLYGDVNVLMVDLPTSRLAQGNTSQTGLAQVEKYTGDAPAPSVFETPANA
ncbi:MAG: trimethylamine-N-oxide reductase TorA [Pseudomonadota bacterium]